MEQPCQKLVITIELHYACCEKKELKNNQTERKSYKTIRRFGGYCVEIVT